MTPIQFTSNPNAYFYFYKNLEFVKIFFDCDANHTYPLFVATSNNHAILHFDEVSDWFDNKIANAKLLSQITPEMRNELERYAKMINFR